VFAVKGDGKELFQSSLTRLADGPNDITLDVTDVRRLELVTEPGGDGKSSDWGIWFDPTLQR